MRKSKIYKAEHLAVKELFYISIQGDVVIHRARPEKG